MPKKFLITESELRNIVRDVMRQNSPGSYDLHDPGDLDELFLPIPDEDKEIIKLALSANNARMGYTSITVGDSGWNLEHRSFKSDSPRYALSHDYNSDNWTGCGPSSQECRTMNYRRLVNKNAAVKFAKNFGVLDGPLKRFFTGGDVFF